MNSLTSYLKHKAALWVIVLLVAAPLLYFRSSDDDEKPNCNPPPVSPRTNADGTVDHVLIRKCEGSNGIYIILRFPADQKLSLSEKMEPTEVGGFGGPTVTLSSSTNRYIFASYDMSNDWKPVPRADVKKLDRKLIADIVFSNWGNDETRKSLERNASDIEVACEAPIRHLNGLLEYRLKKGRDPQTNPKCFQSHINSETARTYVSTNPVAVFDCSAPPKGGDYPGLCTGRVDTREPVHISVHYYNVAEPNAEQVAQAISRVSEQVAKAFVETGELRADDIFSFEKFGGDTK
jgi:hypothetical protein